jgi:polysaccharide deacetylase family protein (PEP-CTERM system associated)
MESKVRYGGQRAEALARVASPGLGDTNTLRGAKHALSVDVEDWTNVQLFASTGRVAAPTDAVARNTEALLQLIERYKAKATWFVLGEVAQAYPWLIRLLAEAGQEIGIHGYHHDFLYNLSRGEFRESVLRAKDVVENAAGKPAWGYRAPSFSITRGSWWLFDVLVEAGFLYDSSIFPFRGRRYGLANSQLVPYDIDTSKGSIREVPLTVASFGGFRVPCCGGGYFRHFPFFYTETMLRHLEKQGRTSVFYFHPHELDPNYNSAFFREHMPVESRRFRFRVYRYLQHRNRRETVRKLSRLLEGRQFGTIQEVFKIGAMPRAVST